jgi:hypothetical protein
VIDDDDDEEDKNNFALCARLRQDDILSLRCVVRFSSSQLKNVYGRESVPTFESERV